MILKVVRLNCNGIEYPPFTSKEKNSWYKEKIYVSYPNLHADVKVRGSKILIDDGKLEVVVIEITASDDVKKLL